MAHGGGGGGYLALFRQYFCSTSHGTWRIRESHSMLFDILEFYHPDFLWKRLLHKICFVDLYNSIRSEPFPKSMSSSGNDWRTRRKEKVGQKGLGNLFCYRFSRQEA